MQENQNIKKDFENGVEKEAIQIHASGEDSEPFFLTWQNIDLKITINKSKKLCGKENRELHVLKNITGYARSGECLAIMGGSGAGKSTLLNILAGRFDVSKNMEFQGKVLLNGQPMSWDKYKNIIGFVMQRDVFMESLQVDEIFRFVVDLRYTHWTRDQKEHKIKEMIRNLKLERAKSNIVGGKMKKGISGGEKRRLNIGFELLTDPKILFLDEPTSGLDSYTSFIIVKLLKELAREKNMLIIYTIHQPSVDIGNLFDRLLILNKGKISYFDNRSNLEDHFKGLGYECPNDMNPLDHAIDVALTGGDIVDQKFFQAFDENPKGLTHVKSQIEQVGTNALNPKIKKASFFQQFRILSKRSLTNFFRNPLTMKIRLIQVVFIAIIFILLYWQLDDVDPTDRKTIQNRLGALFFISINFFILYFQTSLATFPVEREIFVKEYDSGLYGIVPYFFSKILIEFPLTAFFPFLFISIVYHAVNFNSNVENFFLFALGGILIAWIGTIMGIFIGTMVTNLEVAIEIAPMIFVPFILFSGYTTNTDNIVPVLKVIEYISPIRYIFEYFVRNEFSDYSDELGNGDPIETLNFSLSIPKILLILFSYLILLAILSIVFLKINSKGLKN